MRGMILAAGLGQRMGDLTVNMPKPLLRVKNKYLIEYAIDSLIQANIRDIVINIFHHAAQIKAALGDGSRYHARFFYSEEKQRLETGGGILNALSLLGDEPFVIMSSDIITDYRIANLPKRINGLAHLVLVDNPYFHPQGDFGLQNGYVVTQAEPTYTYGNIGILHPDLFVNCKLDYFPLNQLLFPAIKNHQVTAEHYAGHWVNIGTQEDLSHACR